MNVGIAAIQSWFPSSLRGDEPKVRKRGLETTSRSRTGRLAVVITALAGSMPVAAAVPAPSKAATDDLTVIRDRMLAPYQIPPAAARVRQLRARVKPDGSWPDVNYAGNSTVRWEPAEHLQRLLLLTQACFAPKSQEHGNAALAAEIGRALDFWLHKDPRRPWWWDSIGAPGMLSLTLLMYDEHLTEFQRQKGVQILKRAKLGATGQNLVWQAEITARRAVLERDAELLRRAFGLIASEIRLSTGEGIQADFSFHQHGPCLYNHGYGAAFAVDNARLVALTAGTSCAYPPEKISLLARYILDGSQWLAHGAQTDFGAEGREIARPRQTAAYLGDAARIMLAVPTGREDEFRVLAARVAGGDAAPLVGNKHFPRSDIMVHHRPGWYMSARMYSTRTMNTDGLSGCAEGFLSHYLADGATCIMRHGNEYRDLFPAWDWQHVPGTTVELAPHQSGPPQRKGESAFVGGASDGTVGAATFQLARQTLRARKAWFFFSNVVVCLGTDIRCAADDPVVTTLNQCRLRGPVTVGASNGARQVEAGDTLLDARWVWHDGIGYLLDKAAKVRLANVARTGNWKRISGQSPADPVTEHVFLLALSHGVRPLGADYAYAVLPDTSLEAMPSLAGKRPFEVAANSAQVQAVFHSGDAALGLVFHEAGEFAAQGWRVAVDRPCVLVLRQEKDGGHVATADPAAGSGAVRLEISLPQQPARTVSIKLPEGLHAGASTIVRLDGR